MSAVDIVTSALGYALAGVVPGVLSMFAAEDSKRIPVGAVLWSAVAGDRLARRTASRAVPKARTVRR